MLTLDLIPSHAIASWLLGHIDALLDMIGLKRQQTVEEVLYVTIIILASIGIGWCFRRVIVWALRRIVALRKSELSHEMLQQRLLRKCSHIIPPLVFLALVPFAFTTDSKPLVIMEKVTGVYAMICLGIGLTAVFRFIFNRFNTRDNARNLPLKGVLNIAIGINWIIVTIISVSIIIGKSPVVLLTGLGAFAAALMLIFKDSILGFVAGIQMSENDMLRVGDWIVIPKTPANGIVEDVTLSTVKVRNFDKTLVMVPPYTLVSTSFQNYRGMWESGVRRIDVSLIVDLTTVVGCTPDMIASVQKQFPDLAPYIDQMQKDPDHTLTTPGLRGVSGSTLTNLGLFRAYVCTYLLNHPKIAKKERVMIRLQQPVPSGIMMNIWCFTYTTDWDEYEAIASGVLEHVISSAESFGVGIYSSSSLTVNDAPPAHIAAPTKD